MLRNREDFAARAAAAIAVWIALGVGSASASAAESGEKESFTPPSPGPVEPPPPGVDFRDRVIDGQPRRARRLRRPANAYYDQDGHVVRVEVSEGYAPDPQADQALVNFLGSLLHGDEMNFLYVYVATPEEINHPNLCDEGAAACYYGGSLNLMIVTGETEHLGIPTSYAAAHEYGHHVANHRFNDPWPALDWGPKVWASYEAVCPNVVAGYYFPGDQDAGYYLNPGEAFAETFAKYHSSFRNFPWEWDLPPPDQGSYDAVYEDVVNPWDGYWSKRYRGRFGSGRASFWWVRVRTPLDGFLTATLRGPRRSDYDLLLTTANGKRVLERSGSRDSRERIDYLVCGEAALRVYVKRYEGSGEFRLTVFTP